MRILFSSGIVNETREIFLATKWLTATETVLINGKVHQVIAVINLGKVKNWENMKKTSRWVNANLWRG